MLKTGRGNVLDSNKQNRDQKEEHSLKEKKKPGISQCMIVKNEEENIRQALSWGKGIVAEQIVVDTGSTDRTVELAEQMGAKVYHFAWIDDFAAAKNYAIDQASCEWIAFLDADEYFTPEDAAKLPGYLKALGNTDWEGILTGWIHLNNEGKVMAAQSQIRIFRNLPGIRYQRRIHEYLRVNGERSVKMADGVAELSIYHTGYGKKEGRKKSGSGRNFRLLQAELQEHPQDYELWGLIGNEYLSADDLGEAEKCYRKSIALMPEWTKGVYDMTTSGTWLRLLELLTVLPETAETELLVLYSQAVECWPEEADYDYFMGKYYVAHDAYPKAQQHLSRALGLLEKYGNAAKSAFVSGNVLKTYELLAICCFNNGNLAECVQITTMMLQEDSYLMSTLVLLLSAFMRDPGTGGRGQAGAMDVAGFLGGNFYDFQQLKDRLFVLQAAQGAGYQELAVILRGTFTPEELAVVDRALDKSGEGQKENAGKKPERKKRAVLFYSAVESFNCFTDILDQELRKRGYEVFILDLNHPSAEDPHSYKNFMAYLSQGANLAICFDALGVREDLTPGIVDLWDQHQTVIVDILMDPPLRFHPALEHHPQNYILYCCDREHVEYVKQYFGQTVPRVYFMPHVGVQPGMNSLAGEKPYGERSYDILFCGTYYRPQDKLAEIEKICPRDSDAYHLYRKTFENLVKDSDLSIWKGFLLTVEQLGWEIPEPVLKQMLYGCDSLDWAIRMYQRERVISVLAESGLELHLLGRGWEKHPNAGLPNVHHIDDRIPYGETLKYMADARINLNVMPGFKQGTHDRIFNTLLQRSVPLTDSSGWIGENFTDGVDIALYDLKHLKELPSIARRLLSDQELAERIIENGYRKAAEGFTWGHCVDWILEAVTL